MVGRVLVVDDEDTLRLTIKTRLATGGFETDAAVDGEEALEKLKHGRFDVVLLDINMPRMDGITALGVISDLYPKTDVIMLTGFADFTTAIECLKKGAKDYLVKPIDTTELITRMRSLLRARNSEAALDELKSGHAAFLLDNVSGPALIAEQLIKALKGGEFGKVSKDQTQILSAISAGLVQIVDRTKADIDPAVLGKQSAVSQPKSTALSKVISPTVDSLKRMGKAGGLSVEYHPESKTPKVECNPELLGGAFHSILAGMILSAGTEAVISVKESSTKEQVTLEFRLAKTPEKARKAVEQLSKSPVGLQALENSAVLWISARNTIQRHQGKVNVALAKGSMTITCELPVHMKKS